ncbi:MAG: hypothetical protein H0W74_08000 [Sphingosinicella sp.]|nr:hypothetical protein [Sphingosinicella sp.]
MAFKTFTTAFILPLLLLACGKADQDGEEADNGATASERAGNAAPAPPATPKDPEEEDALALAALTPEGWGPLKIGMTLAEIGAALGPDADPGAVGGAEPSVCDQFRPARAPRGLLVMVEKGRLSRVSLINDSPVRTDKGLGVGDGAGEVAGAYGAAAITSPHEYVGKPAAYMDAWVGGGGGSGSASVTAPSARGIRYEIDGKGVVSAIHAGGPSIQYVEGCS